MKNLSLALIFALGLLSCDKDEHTPTDNSNNLIYYYDRIENGNLQVYSYDGVKETNLVNDNAYDYWWIKVNPGKTKFLCYRSPKNAGVNSYTTCELMVYNIDGSNGHVIIPLNSYAWEIQAHAKWSPDGTKITYVGPSDLSDETNPEKAEIYQATLNNTTMKLENVVRLTFDDKYCYDPAWSPDGNWIAYSKGSFINLFFTVDHDIYKCSPDGSKDILVLHDGKVNGVPTWTPNGERLLFHVLGLYEPPPFSLYSCSANGNDKKNILSTDGVKRSTITAVEK